VNLKVAFRNCATALVRNEKPCCQRVFILTFLALFAKILISNYEEDSRFNRNGCTHLTNPTLLKLSKAKF
jgi:hypothetical protein